MQYSYQTQYQTMKWVFKLSIPSSVISGSNCEILSIIDLQPNLPVWLYKKGNVLDKNCTQGKFKSHIQHERSWLWWIVIEQVNFTNNTTFCLYFLNKFFSHIFKASSEESCCVLRKTRQSIWGSICGRVFFRKLAGWLLATSLRINLFTYKFRGF